MKYQIPTRMFVLLFMFLSLNSFACDCDCQGDCSFKGIIDQTEFIALVKVIEYSDYLYYKDDRGYDKKMPFSTTVEIVKIYQGNESRKRIKIWGDDGMLCRPYASAFQLDSYYIIAPRKIKQDSEFGKKDDFHLFSCWTDYLAVDLDKNRVFGTYSKQIKNISLTDFEGDFKN